MHLIKFLHIIHPVSILLTWRIHPKCISFTILPRPRKHHVIPVPPRCNLFTLRQINLPRRIIPTRRYSHRSIIIRIYFHHPLRIPVKAYTPIPFRTKHPPPHTISRNPHFPIPNIIRKHTILTLSIRPNKVFHLLYISILIPTLPDINHIIIPLNSHIRCFHRLFT